ncbi:MAG: tRNA pseudouridine(55) synthase TruB, partial [Bacilli bacterium]|nr:tRNA pseudouridine(55) synthase TruB [Bacilli bacterium]
SLDITGKTIIEKETIISKEKVLEALNHFKGSYDQEVPKYSAVKINGKKLYEYARSGKEIELPKRKVTIYDISLQDYKIKDNKTHIKFKVTVSKGTYIRSLIRDIAKYLNTYGTMSNLIRTSQGKFTLNQSKTIEEVSNEDVKKIKDVLDMPQITVDEEEKFKILNGQKLNYNYEEVLFLDSFGTELAIYKKQNSTFKIYKMLYEKENK